MHAITVRASPPTVATITPDHGLLRATQRSTITGSNFQNGATVAFDGALASHIAVIGATGITLNTPAHGAGTVDIVVTNPDGQISDGIQRVHFCSHRARRRPRRPPPPLPCRGRKGRPHPRLPQHRRIADTADRDTNCAPTETPTAAPTATATVKPTATATNTPTPTAAPPTVASHRPGQRLGRRWHESDDSRNGLRCERDGVVRWERRVEDHRRQNATTITVDYPGA